MVKLNNAEFLERLSVILLQNDGKSSVYFTQKRLSPSLNTEDANQDIHDLSSNVFPSTSFQSNNQSYGILIRATINSGKKASEKVPDKGALAKTKISTVVETSNLDKFWKEYTQQLKNGFVGLKKKERKKKKTSKVSK